MLVIQEVDKIKSKFRVDEDFLREKRSFYKGWLRDAEIVDEYSREWLNKNDKNKFLDYLFKKIPGQKFEASRGISVQEYIYSLSVHYPVLSKLVETIKIERYLDIVKSIFKNRVCRVFIWDSQNGYCPRNNKYFDLRTMPEELRSSIIPYNKDSQFVKLLIEHMVFKILLNITKEKDILPDKNCNTASVLACRLFSIHPSNLNEGLIKFASKFMRIFSCQSGSLTGKLSYLLGVSNDKSNFYIEKFLSSFPKISSYVDVENGQYLLPNDFYSIVNGFTKRIFSIDSSVVPIIPLFDGGLFELPKYGRVDAWIEEVNKLCGQYGLVPEICLEMSHW